MHGTEFEIGLLDADVKNRRGNTSRGRKITGMQFMPKDPSQLLITSNDSRIRLYEGTALQFTSLYIASVCRQLAFDCMLAF